MTALIDADTIIHVVAYNYKDISVTDYSIKEIYKVVDQFIDMILTVNQADFYIGAIGDDNKNLCFRTDIYKYAKYKGNRPPTAEWVVAWKPHIKKRMIEEWGFISNSLLEADDIIAFFAEKYHNANLDFVICSPDKDMKQLPGRHYNYKVTGANFIDALTLVSEEEANFNLYVQVLSGDSSDNLFGIPGLGPSKAKKLLASVEPMLYKSTIIQAYCKYFGEYYGPIIFEQNWCCIQLVTSKHVVYPLVKDVLLQSVIRPYTGMKIPDSPSSVFGS